MSVAKERRAPGAEAAPPAAAPGRERRIACLPAVLDTNPYQGLLYGSLGCHGFSVEPHAAFTVRWLVRHRRDVGIVHFHWPQGHYRHRGREDGAASWAKLGVFALRLATARAAGYRVVWTIHQVDPHETSASGRLDRVAARLLATSAHALIAHDEVTARRARDILGRAAARVAIVPHGSYIGVYPPGRGRDEVRAELGIARDAPVLLALGDLRAYKGLPGLLAAFARLDRRDAVLVVAGAARDPAQAGVVREAARRDPRVRALIGFVPDGRVAELYGAADAAVLPRLDGGTSGALILALSLGCPPVVADAPGYRALLGEGAGWYFDPADPAALTAALAAAAAAGPDDAGSRGRRCVEIAEGLDWDEIGRMTAPLLDPREASRGG